MKAIVYLLRVACDSVYIFFVESMNYFPNFRIEIFIEDSLVCARKSKGSFSHYMIKNMGVVEDLFFLKLWGRMFFFD